MIRAKANKLYLITSTISKLIAKFIIYIRQLNVSIIISLLSIKLSSFM